MCITSLLLFLFQHSAIDRLGGWFSRILGNKNNKIWYIHAEEIIWHRDYDETSNVHYLLLPYFYTLLWLSVCISLSLSLSLSLSIYLSLSPSLSVNNFKTKIICTLPFFTFLFCNRESSYNYVPFLVSL